MTSAPLELSTGFAFQPLVKLERNEREEIERAVAQKVPEILAAAEFAGGLYRAARTEVEVKVWLETGLFPACVAVHWEARLSKFYFLVLDGSERERVGAVVFDRVASVDAETVNDESRVFYETLHDVFEERPGMDTMDAIAALQSRYRKRVE